jgi:hypothetical protein
MVAPMVHSLVGQMDESMVWKKEMQWAHWLVAHLVSILAMM